MLRRYGKSAEGILGVRQNFFDENAAALALATSQAKIYVSQPRRTYCKLCDQQLPERPDFIKLSIPYVSCPRCGQLNGMHEDTDAFCEAVYLDDSYAIYYGSADSERYQYRTNAIYRPKVDFLSDVLAADGVQANTLRHADFGSGSGYFVGALLDAGIDRCTGLDVSPAQIEFANRMVPGNRSKLIDLNETVSTIRELDADVISMIGVLEHLQTPRAVLGAIRDNPRLQYLFLCVPLYGLCVFFEMIFPHIHPRHLVTDHTHLFTKTSLTWMESAYRLTRRGEWWFGSDMLDLYRAVLVTLSEQEGTRGMTDQWVQRMRPLIDPMQLAIDQQHLASEVHVVFRIER